MVFCCIFFCVLILICNNILEMENPVSVENQALGHIGQPLVLKIIDTNKLILAPGMFTPSVEIMPNYQRYYLCFLWGLIPCDKNLSSSDSESFQFSPLLIALVYTFGHLIQFQ